ncbi:MAG: cell wall metabolism sensor histidine kinase WalK [Clostridium sp.]|jgi:two-component system phosphate regulon sensor histidine kinase PhoR|uniref:two-component system histidine kinase PnpS n=1 Tax=Clostridium sp. TaxID=1506 RepID=UPI0025BCF36A|nr:HAMP domain-containing sensor histidine kinase [Clostridium sp.]MCH3964065.1 cell wall metabolism sensor histidine kinase WalK [Clostridium sp.]MCI1716266.1 cell wall metabolism sensor histidine kinase WalK [Clostridium sp.]MCI1800494.1 cell wall metabolism sensor histidine kinase WalK [Clostridium sp.]MCI1814443.1 cell wall metabolism sensor histidine kinase WalK [Clostridium sp.]MCI1871342.1 cell wall metabolism sensor histidine kinase WalK [Clostridium sp.]
MKKKLMKSMLGILMLSLITMTVLFMTIENQEYIQNMKQTLKINNQMVINAMRKTDNKNNKGAIFKNYFKDTTLRGTYIDKKGDVISDSEEYGKKLENHNSRKEIEDARKYGTGYDVRVSATTNKKTLYFATMTGDGDIVRSAMTMQMIKGLEMTYYKYYILVMILSILLSSIFITRLSHSLVAPVKKLQEITRSMADGNLDRRVKIDRKDEIGKLADTFNNMAERLQSTLNDSINQNNKLEAILKSMDSGVIAIDTNYRIIMINPYAEEIFGINSEIIGRNLMDSIRDFELENVFKNDDNKYREIKIIWPRERNLRIKTADIINNSRNKIGTVAVVQDITDIKKLENMRSEFVANVSHELKTPLTSIKGFSETLRYVDDTENKNKFIDIINDEADRLTRLIDDTLTLSHIENNRDRIVEKIDVVSEIKSVCYLVDTAARKKNIKIITEFSKSLYIYGNKDKFKQMMINLVDNAIKYSDNGGQVKITASSEDEVCVIEVEDNGVGISKEHQERLFERFYRVDKARSRSQGGTGLGLAIVKHIVMGFAGSIKVESEIGKGSKFIVRIPIEEGS